MCLWQPEIYGSPPWEYTSYVLRRDIYHCTDAELQEMDWVDVSSDIVIMSAIAKVQNRQG